MTPITFMDTLRIEVAALQAAKPERMGEIARAHALIVDGWVVDNQDGTGKVLSSSMDHYYTVNGACECEAAVHGQTCKHLSAWRLYQRVAKKQASLEEPMLEPISRIASSVACTPEEEGIVQESYTVAQESIECSAQVGALMAALARAQARMSNPGLDSTNPHFHTRYASLAAVRDAVVPVLAAEGIAVTQLPPTQGWVAVTTGLWHQSGQYLCTTLRLPVPKADPQGYGTAITYARRYALQAIAMVAGEQDDDAESLRDASHGNGKR